MVAGRRRRAGHRDRRWCRGRVASAARRPRRRDDLGRCRRTARLGRQGPRFRRWTMGDPQHLDREVDVLGVLQRPASRAPKSAGVGQVVSRPGPSRARRVTWPPVGPRPHRVRHRRQGCAFQCLLAQRLRLSVASTRRTNPTTNRPPRTRGPNANQPLVSAAVPLPPATSVDVPEQAGRTTPRRRTERRLGGRLLLRAVKVAGSRFWRRRTRARFPCAIGLLSRQNHRCLG